MGHLLLCKVILIYFAFLFYFWNSDGIVSHFNLLFCLSHSHIKHKLQIMIIIRLVFIIITIIIILQYSVHCLPVFCFPLACNCLTASETFQKSLIWCTAPNLFWTNAFSCQPYFKFSPYFFILYVVQPGTIFNQFQARKYLLHPYLLICTIHYPHIIWKLEVLLWTSWWDTYD